METQWLTIIEAAQYLRMGKSTAYKLVQEGKLPTHKVGRQGRQKSGGRFVDEEPRCLI
ncbi:MAG TPA: helix-turn-helix domain-containing protein [Candidatus Sumerlaeota bacterium]|jgi:excisionase family DNA binding protein|nr:MAG: Helix-turn-helix domain protein [candidate division BRC1 bacterium ADurb.Bin183]HOE64052.1 helix-turn-helix domain-containing protein [Candidatus Sumerlaeota bacterium]HRR31111.1 helix-turn-helix domain-containing protein [Candidatus Sumerlaeia bacterium]HON48995.1 helix-turn-helix domain-containing protein [Candidatus Sumerlaeota bacterium]HOR64397.1 helix-turn-helix domain-containing protein [Candidatus Sumerlaeota bacterium]